MKHVHRPPNANYTCATHSTMLTCATSCPKIMNQHLMTARRQKACAESTANTMHPAETSSRHDRRTTFFTCGFQPVGKNIRGTQTEGRCKSRLRTGRAEESQPSPPPQRKSPTRLGKVTLKSVVLLFFFFYLNKLFMTLESEWLRDCPEEMTLDQYQAEQKRKAAERKEKQLKQQARV